MNKYLISIVAFFSLCISSTFAATVEVNFIDPDNYVDIRHGDRIKNNFQQDFFHNIRTHLGKLAKDLPDDQTLKVDVLDIDLAGDVRMFDARLFRLVKEPFAPRIKFSYRLEDEKKTVLLQGEENIRDANFLQRQRLRYRNENFPYEKRLLEEWYKDTFSS